MWKRIWKPIWNKIDKVLVSNNMDNGTSQRQRLKEGLHSNAVLIDNRDELTLWKQFKRLSKEVPFYSNELQVEGNWAELFFLDDESATEAEELSEFYRRASEAPHVSLLAVFFKLFSHAQNEINGLTSRHLLHFYKNTLGIKEKTIVPDNAYIHITLSKDKQELLLPQGTSFSGGKDATEEEMLFSTCEDAVLNKCEVTHIRTLFIDAKKKSPLQFAEIKNAVLEKETKASQGKTSWGSFGEWMAPGQLEENGGVANSLECGFEVTSPLLYLSGGERKVSLLLEATPNNSLKELHRNPDYKELSSFFDVYASLENEWAVLEKESVLIEPVRNGIRIHIEIDEGFPSIASDSDVRESDFSFPGFRFRLNPRFSSVLYMHLCNLHIKRVHIKVDVTGLRDVTVNKEATTDKPFYPFGSDPRLGSRFELTHPELNLKRLNSLSIDLSWHAPGINDFDEYYKDYGSSQKGFINNSDFVVKGYVYKNKAWTSFENNIYALFDEYDVQSVNRIKLWEAFPSVEASSQELTDGELRERLVGVSTQEPEPFLSLELHGPDKGDAFAGFGHANFPKIHLEKTLQMIKTVSKSKKDFVEKIDVIRDPYTPALKELAMNYVSEEVCEVSSELSFPVRLKRFSSFGATSLDWKRETTLLPFFNQGGTLLLGFDKVQVNESVHLLFRMDENSIYSKKALSENDFTWEYLSQAGWKALSAEFILKDTTCCFQKTGFIGFVLPIDASDKGSSLDRGSYWIRIACSSPEETARCFDIQTQCVLVKRMLPKEGSNTLKTRTVDAFLNNPMELPAGAINKAISNVAGIEDIWQSDPSFGGRSLETANELVTRASERLRHKNRLVQKWDYERIILEHFPSINQVKCLNHTNPHSYKEPGCVTVLVMPKIAPMDFSGTGFVAPKVPIYRLEEILAYLKKHSSPFVSVYVENPVFEQVRCSFEVAFKDRQQNGLLKRKLNTELIAFISPWLLDTKREISFDQVIHESQIIQFMEELDYVDYVIDFKMTHGYQEDDESKEVLVHRLRPSSPKSIILSSGHHEIKPISHLSSEKRGMDIMGIGFGIIGESFEVG